jgi:hypothetical protein
MLEEMRGGGIRGLELREMRRGVLEDDDILL